MISKPASSIASEIRVSPLWVIGPLAALGLPIVFVTETVSGALDLKKAIFFLLFYAVLGAAWLLTRRNYAEGKWFISIAFTGMICLGFVWWKTPELLILMVIPPVLAAVLISLPASLLTTIAETILLLLFFLGGDVSLTTITMLVVTIWAMLGLMVAAYNPVYKLADWSWNYFQRAQVLLEESRNRKVELQQALDDLTRANQQLTRMNRLAQGLRRMAEEARKVKEEFVAQVSHELRTPLNMIIGYSETILQSPEIYGTNLPSALLADLAVIFKNAEHLSDLIDDVLDLTEIETEQMAITKEEVHLHEIVEAATLAVRPLFESKGLYLKVDVPRDLPPLFCDRVRIREVLLNLLSNAGRFTKQGGVQVNAWQQEHDLIVTVADTGPGISVADRVKLFQPFQQLSSSIRKQFGGSGLGLNISKRFLELHGGDIWVDSAFGVGTTFSFRLPIALSMPADLEVFQKLRPDWEYHQHTRPSKAPRAVAQSRFVVLDKANILPRFLTRYLANAEIVSVANLEQAFQELTNSPSTALVVNDMSVEQTLQRLESSELPPGTPALICSIPYPAEVTSTLGAFDYLVKPISRDLLLATLDRLGVPIKTVLIIDDQSDMLRLYRRMLFSSKRNYRVVQAKNGREAMKILRQEKPDVILLDLVMSKMDGLQFLKTRNKEAALRDIPVIVVSVNDPTSQPAVSSAFVVVKRGGLSMQELLVSIKQTATLLSTIAPSADPTPPATPPVGLAFE